MEMDEEEKPWKVVNSVKKKKKNQQLRPWEVVNRMENKNKNKKQRPWDTLPSLALSNIFRNLDFKDRCNSIPFVCKAWNSVISGDPYCWSSMIPEYVSPDDAFIKNIADYYSINVYLPQCDESLLSYRHLLWMKLLLYHSNLDDAPSRLHWDDYHLSAIRGSNWDGVSRFQTLLKRSSSSSSSSSSANNNNYNTSTITCLYLDFFRFSYPYNEESLDQDEILHLVAHCCPNLKHISFDGFYCASKEAVLEVFHRCNKLELIDFSDTEYNDFLMEVVTEETRLRGNHCWLPHLRGIRILLCNWSRRMNAWMTNIPPHTVNDIATHFPRIKLLDIECRFEEVPRLLSSSSAQETQLLELQYLRVGVIRQWPQVCPTHSHIPEFHYEFIDGLFELDPSPGCYCTPRHRWTGQRRRLCNRCRREAKEAKEKEDLFSRHYYSSSYHLDEEDYSILKQKKEHEYYVSILKEKKKEKRRNHHHEYVLMRTGRFMKKKNNKANVEIDADAASSSSILKIMKKKTRGNKYDYYLDDDYHFVVCTTTTTTTTTTMHQKHVDCC